MNRIPRFFAITLFVGVIGSFIWFLCVKDSGRQIVPMKMSRAKTPSIDVEIQGVKFLLDVDYGSKFQLTLSEEILDCLDKQPVGVLVGRDGKGNSYDSNAYLISKVVVGNSVFSNVVVKQLDEGFIKNTTLYTNMSDLELVNDKNGVIGRGILEKMSLLLDFHNLFILESNNLDVLIKRGFFPEKYLVVPFNTGRTGLLLNIDTDIGQIRLSLDTGSTVSLLRASRVVEGTDACKSQYGMPIFTSEKFVIAGKDFGRSDLYLYDITSELHEIDGVLGMNFLEGRILYIDYPNKMIYIGDAEGNQTVENEIISKRLTEPELKKADNSVCKDSATNHPCFDSLDENCLTAPKNNNYKETVSEETRISGSEEEHIVKYSAKNKTNSVTYKLETTTKKDRFGKMKGNVKAGVDVTWE
ncbi:MAG: hypothetical protein V4494_01785 [Chlamydiota bacterium]